MSSVPNEPARPANEELKLPGRDPAVEHAKALFNWVLDNEPPLNDGGDPVAGTYYLLFAPRVVAAFRRQYHLLRQHEDRASLAIKSLSRDDAVTVGDLVTDLVNAAIRFGMAAEREIGAPWFQFDSFIKAADEAMEARVRDAEVSSSAPSATGAGTE